MGKRKAQVVEEPIIENISVEPLESVMGDRYATYAKYVIQDRAIPDVRDGMKPVQRRIIYTMYKNNNTINKPTKKCAHTVGAVMGTFHPHGDTSIYEALARMSQDWKLRYPLIDFQGNNGSIDGDSPAAYRYTESRLAELSNELVRDLEKNTVEMMLNFDDTELEPTVLPARFPNLFVNGTEGIAVALATEIPPHNLKEVIEAVIYRINHKNVTSVDLMEFVKGPDFPGGGFIFQGPGLEAMYTTGRGRIEMCAKAEIVSNKDNQQIIITELPYKAVKIQTVYEIDKIRHSKAIDGILEVRDESDYQGIKIVVDLKKDAKADLILAYLMDKTSLKCGYSANMVAIVDGRPKTLDLLTYVDAYIAHQVDVITRKTKFDLNKCENRLHIVDGLITASLNINEVVNIIRKSNDKQDSKNNLMARFGFSTEQAEAIVTMPLYKLSHTDEEILIKEKASLEAEILKLKGILEDPNKLNRYLIKDLRAIENKYGDDRRTQIIEKIESKPIDKRELIAKEEVMISITQDGYLKRSTVKSYRSSNDILPGIKDGDILVAAGSAMTTDYIVCFTNKGNYITIPVHKMTENRWKDEGTHINDFTTLGAGEKIIRVFSLPEIRNDLYLAILSKFGQIKRMPLSEIDLNKHSKPQRAMKILGSDSIVGVELLSGNSDILVITSAGNAVLYNENELTIVSSKAGGVKSINGLNNATASALLTFEESDRTKVLFFTDKSHVKVVDIAKALVKGGRLNKPIVVVSSFKNDVHKVVGAVKVDGSDSMNLSLYLSDHSSFLYTMTEFYLTDYLNAKKNIPTPAKTLVARVFPVGLQCINNRVISHPVTSKTLEENNDSLTSPDTNVTENNNKVISSNEQCSSLNNTEKEPVKEEKSNKEEGNFEQISIFDDIDD